MKKLLIISIAVFVSVVSRAQLNPDTEWPFINPYVYDMKSSLITNNQYIRLTYTLSGKSFGNEDKYANLNAARGIQIYLLYKDEFGEWQRITDLAQVSGKISSGGKIVCGGYANAQTYTVDIPLTAIPDKYKSGDIAWEAVVHGNKGRTKPQVVDMVPAGTHQPTNAFGVAVNTNPEHSRFAQIFASEAYPSKRTGYKNANAGTMVEYGPWLDNLVCPHHKHYHNGNAGAYFNTADGLYYEPHRVKISEDGRMFVSSFHPKALCAVYEYVSAYNYHNVVDYNWNTAEIKGSDTDPLLYKRCIGMDVKGRGDSLKIVLGWIDANADGGNKAKLEVWEYALGDAEDDGAYYVPSGYLAAFTEGQYVRKIGEYNIDKQTSGAGQGLLCQGFNGKWNNALFGFVDLAYGDNDDVWIKVDYASNVDVSEGRIVRMSTKGAFETSVVASLPATADGFYGGSGIYVKKNMLITGTGENKIRFYDIAYSADGKTASLAEKTDWCLTDSRIGRWVTGFAEDYVGNLYATTEGNNWTSGTSYTSNVLAIAMPYSGSKTTRAKATVAVGAVPNILATDVRYTPDGNTDRYIFSFNVNTKPAIAQIRFYSSYDDMKKSINVVHADDYDGLNTIEPDFVYNIPASKLKQGKISVSLGMCGGELSGTMGSGECVITNDALPAGEWYWSVYVEAKKSQEFGMIYKQGNSGEDAHYRLHATVNTYPETDGFGQVYAAQYNGSTGKKSMMVYAFNPNGTTTSNSYKLVKEYLNATGSKPQFTNQRRPTVAPDGKVYIADHGATNFDANAIRPMMFNGGGIYVWNPNTQTGNELQLQQFLKDKTETSSGVAIWNHGGTLKLYGMNTYGEFEFHSLNNKLWKGNIYDESNQTNPTIYGWNGFKEYNLGTPNNILLTETTGTVQRSLGMGDAGGNTSIVAMDKGIWICQHRENDVQYTIDQFLKDRKTTQALPDNTYNYLLSFVPYNSNTRTWRSCTTNGINYSNKVGDEYQDYDFNTASDLTQKTSSPVQSSPGAGMAYRRIDGVDYIFMVQHTGDIAQLKVTWSGTTPSVTHYKTYTSVGTKTTVPYSSRKTGTITTMCFDYAGNLVTTAGATYFGHQQDIIVYTMPYNRVNAQEIQAPNSCRYIPERMAQTYDKHEDIISPYLPGGAKAGKTCGLDFYRPMMKGSFNSICLPFDLTSLVGTPYEGATVMKYKGASYRVQNGEGMVDFNFEEVTTINAGEPYLIKLKDGAAVSGMARFTGVTMATDAPDEVSMAPITGEGAPSGAKALYQGVFDLKTWSVVDKELFPVFVLMDKDRLGQVLTYGDMYGFRGYFRVQGLPTSTKAAISMRKPTATGLVDHKGQEVDIEKFMREGRVYIRVGEALYTIAGERVE